MNQRTQRGFTLWELLTTLLVVGVLLGVGVPNLMEFQRNNVMISAANEMISGLYLARTEAVKRQAPVTLCGSADPLVVAPVCSFGGNGGYIVFVDENGNGFLNDITDGNANVDPGEVVLLQVDAPGGTINVFGDGGQYIAYASTGFALTRAPGQAQNATTALLYCDERGNRDAGGRSAARAVQIIPTGRAQVLRSQFDVGNAVGITGGICP